MHTKMHTSPCTLHRVTRSQPAYQVTITLSDVTLENGMGDTMNENDIISMIMAHSYSDISVRIKAAFTDVYKLE